MVISHSYVSLPQGTLQSSTFELNVTARGGEEWLKVFHDLGIANGVPPGPHSQCTFRKSKIFDLLQVQLK